MKRTWKTVAFLALLTGSVSAVAGTLVVGTPEVDGNQVTVPILLDGPQEGVSALDFRLNYDPGVFSPAGVNAGSAASAANKQVQSNVIKDGELVVIAMGMNQNEFQPGEVARITMEYSGNAQAGESPVSITNTTLASAQGQEIASSGSVRAIDLDALAGALDGDGSDEGSDNETPSDSDGEDEAPDVTQPSKESEEDMQVARQENDSDDTTSASPANVSVSDDSGSATAAPSVTGGGGVQVGGEDAAAGAETDKSLSQLAAAANTARNLRDSISAPAKADGSVPSASAGGAGSRPGGAGATPGQPGDGTKQTGDQAVEGVVPEARSASEGMKMASVEPTDEGGSPQAQQPEPGDQTSAREDVSADAPSSIPMKWILLGVVAAVLVAVFLVRRRLFG